MALLVLSQCPLLVNFQISVSTCIPTCPLNFSLLRLLCGSNLSILTDISATFSTPVTCDPTLLSVTYDGYFPTYDDLNSLYTSSCLRSLNGLQRTQRRLCSKHDILSVSRALYLATFTVETLLWTYNFTCRRDLNSGDFCAPIFDA